MRLDRVVFKERDIKLIDIDCGHIHKMPQGKGFSLTKVMHQPTKLPEPRLYYTLEGTRLGQIEPAWLRMESQGLVELVRIAEDDDPRLDGIPLPITDRKQLTQHQIEHLICGHIVKGKFLCTKCALTHSLTYPDVIAVYPINILPYSQACKQCGLLIFSIWKRPKTGAPLELFQ